MKKNAGYLTVELIITLIVGAVLVLSLNTIVVSHAYLSERSRNVVLANAFAEFKIESLRSAGYLGVTNGTYNITSELSSALGSPKSATLVISSYTSAIKKAHLTVTFNEQGTPRTQVYITYIGELGVGQY